MAIQLRPVRFVKVTIAVPRQMVFQMLSAIGNGQTPGSQGDQARVLCRSDNTIIAEFHTRAGFRTYVTVEEVTLYPPERMTFRHVKGPLSYVWEEFTLEEEQGTTVLTYRGEFIANDWPVVGRSAGWLIGRLYVKPLFERVVGKHLRGIKEAAEARARRSHVFNRASAPEKRGAA